MYLRHLLALSTDRGAPRPSPSGSFTQLFLLLGFVAHALAINPGQLEVKINTGLAEKGKYVYNSIAQFRDDVSATWSNEQIVRIAEQAYSDMVAAVPGDRRTYPHLKQASVVSVIVKGHSAYISSSLTGGSSFLYIPNDASGDHRLKYTPGIVSQGVDAGILEWALMACEVRSTSAAGHRSGGNCGEPMAALAFVQTNPTATLDGAKVVTWGKFKPSKNEPYTTGVMDPCSGGGKGMGYADTWGCAQLTGPKGLNMIVIGAGTASVDTVLDYDPTPSYPCYA